jgi:TrmH family RNA methyltransferase
VKSITSETNPHFRQWLRICSAARAVRAAGQTLAEGLHLAQAALTAGVAVQGIVLRRGASHAQIEPLLGAFAASVPRWELSAPLYDRIAPVEQGSGLILVLPVPEIALPLGATVDMVYLDGVQDPGNVGTLIRTAAAAGARHVLASEGTAALWSPKVLRAGMGAHFGVGLHERVQPGQLRAVLSGDWVVAVAHEAPSLWQAQLGDQALGWIFGAERGGPSAAALAAADRRIRIPTHAAVESLNVGAAAAVCLFERLRQIQLRSVPRETPAGP